MAGVRYEEIPPIQMRAAAFAVQKIWKTPPPNPSPRHSRGEGLGGGALRAAELLFGGANIFNEMDFFNEMKNFFSSCFTEKSVFSVIFEFADVVLVDVASARGVAARTDTFGDGDEIVGIVADSAPRMIFAVFHTVVEAHDGRFVSIRIEPLEVHGVVLVDGSLLRT